MKIRNTGGEGEKIELQMTPMIDIVFQLLVFFIMTFKIVAMEGDFNIRMPAASQQAAPPDQMEFPPMKLYLSGNEDGTLAGIRLNEESLPTVQHLNSRIQELIRHGDCYQVNLTRPVTLTFQAVPDAVASPQLCAAPHLFIGISPYY